MSLWRTASFAWAQVTRQVSRIFTSVDAFIIHRFLLLYVNFSSDAAFVELHLLD